LAQSRFFSKKQAAFLVLPLKYYLWSDSMKLKGSQILLKMLEEEKVDLIFGYPGGAVLDIYDQLYKSKLKHILVRHEQGAVHAADGYARATGKVGVCLVTSGPGATNTVTGIATANMDSIPVVVFTGQVPTTLIGNDAFQESDITGITRPCTKHNFLVRSVEELAATIKKLFISRDPEGPGRCWSTSLKMSWPRKQNSIRPTSKSEITMLRINPFLRNYRRFWKCFFKRKNLC